MRHGTLVIRAWIGPDGQPRAAASVLPEGADVARAISAARSSGEHAQALLIESDADLKLPALESVNPILATAKLHPLSS